jgi:hypothetical protein
MLKCRYFTPINHTIIVMKIMVYYLDRSDIIYIKGQFENKRYLFSEISDTAPEYIKGW